MKVYNTKELIKNIQNKGIQINESDKEKFIKNDYYQVINAYKLLFIVGVESIDDILINIKTNKDIDRYKKYFSIINDESIDQLENIIIDSISKKYGINNNLNNIRQIGYIHHIYDPNVNYDDFLRIYKFEHELRNTLLKYTLLIENNIKRIFINTLNDSQNIEDNFLTDIRNYNTTSTNNSKTIETLKMVLNLHKKIEYKPISRKIKQNLTVPYWILINEMTFGETINCIKNLKQQYYDLIYENLAKEFTSKTLKLPKDTKIFRDFKRMLDYISSFRNVLAHNQPIFNYNYKNDSLEKFPNFEFSEPKMPIKNINYDLKDFKLSQKVKNYQHEKNKYLLQTCEYLFGNDFFNCDNRNNKDLDLSFIIYLLIKFNKNIDNDSELGVEIYSIFIKYSIIIKRKNDIPLIKNQKYISNFKFNNKFEEFTGITEKTLESFKNS